MMRMREYVRIMRTVGQGTGNGLLFKGEAIECWGETGSQMTEEGVSSCKRANSVFVQFC